MTNEDIKKDDLQNDEDIDMKEEELDINEEAEVEASDDEKYQDLTDKFMRLQADFSNYKRRTEAQKSEYVELGVKKIANDLLPVIDNFERALDSIKDKDSTYEGILMIKNQLTDVLAKDGIVEMEALGQEFDPMYHHAVLTEDSDEYDSGYVIEVLQKGYLINEKTLIPAMVKVSQ
ncbi:MAG: nucleotide exchange factor GrpE [Peptoniphilus harei]|nr:nucleotide exchange factor GrpE [Peptoniphilus harei]